jgi:hypothetical protein
MDLDCVAAEWYLGLYPPEKMPAVACWALEAGYDGPALRELAACTNTTRGNHGVLIERAFRELGKEPLSLADAGRLLASVVCREIISGKASPCEGASRLWTAYNRCGLPKSLVPFVGFASEWEEDVSHREHYEKLIRKAAQKFLDDVPSPL